MKLLKKKEEEKRNKHKQQNIIQDVELIYLSAEASPQKFNLPHLGKTSVIRKQSVNRGVNNTFESPTRSVNEIPIHSVKSNVSRDGGLIRNIDLDMIYNTSLSNINDQTMIIDLNKQSIPKYDGYKFPDSAKNTAHTFSVMNKITERTKSPPYLKQMKEGSLPRKTENYMSQIMAGYNPNKKDRSSRSNYSERVNMVSQYETRK